MIEKRMNKEFFADCENIRVSFFSIHKKKTMHTHEFWEMSYVYEGDGINHTERESNAVADGELIIISPGAAHSLVSPPETTKAMVKVCNCLFTADYYERLMKKYLRLTEISGYEFYSIIKL